MNLDEWLKVKYFEELSAYMLRNFRARSKEGEILCRSRQDIERQIKFEKVVGAKLQHRSKHLLLNKFINPPVYLLLKLKIPNYYSNSQSFSMY